MDTGTALLVASLMALLNGGVLGLMHRSLLPEVRPSAADWRIGTLLFAGGGILTAMRDRFPPGFVLPLAFGLLFVGACLYWRACRRFCGLDSGLWVFLPAAIGVPAVYAFTAPFPESHLRTIVASAAIMAAVLAAGWTLHASERRDIAVSGRVLTLLLLFVGAAMLIRAIYSAIAMSVPDAAPVEPWLDGAASVVIATLPVIGTTAFLLMCAERGRLALQRAADTDELTGLPNRRSIGRVGAMRFDAAKTAGRGFAIAVIDVDFFKQINDRYGHEVGDAALRHVAAVLESRCPPPHFLGRQGGEEFVALLDCADTDEAVAIAETLRRAVDDAPFETGDRRMPISASIGVGVAGADDREFDDPLRRADRALYTAKARGRNRVEFGRAE